MTTILVKEEHIDKGVRVDPRRCMLARAIGDVVIDDLIVGVLTSREKGCVQFQRRDDETVAFRAYLPDEANRAGRAFDQGETVEPFEFPLDIPAEYLRPAPGVA